MFGRSFRTTTAPDVCEASATYSVDPPKRPGPWRVRVSVGGASGLVVLPADGGAVGVGPGRPRRCFGDAPTGRRPSSFRGARCRLPKIALGPGHALVESVGGRWCRLGWDRGCIVVFWGHRQLCRLRSLSHTPAHRHRRPSLGTRWQPSRRRPARAPRPGPHRGRGTSRWRSTSGRRRRTRGCRPRSASRRTPSRTTSRNRRPGAPRAGEGEVGCDGAGLSARLGSPRCAAPSAAGPSPLDAVRRRAVPRARPGALSASCVGTPLPVSCADARLTGWPTPRPGPSARAQRRASGAPDTHEPARFGPRPRLEHLCG